VNFGWEEDPASPIGYRSPLFGYALINAGMNEMNESRIELPMGQPVRASRRSGGCDRRLWIRGPRVADSFTSEANNPPRRFTPAKHVAATGSVAATDRHSPIVNPFAIPGLLASRAD
jgi:hypothetical protein